MKHPARNAARPWLTAALSLAVMGVYASPSLADEPAGHGHLDERAHRAHEETRRGGGPGLSAAVVDAQPGVTPLPRTDAEVVGVVRALNDSEVQAAELARARASNAQVRRFAEMMISDHTAANAQLASVAAVAPQPSPLREHLAAQSAAQMRALEPLRGAAFDHAYMQIQLQAHQQALQLLVQMGRGVQDPQVRGALTRELRPHIVHHLREAQRLYGQVSMATGRARR